MSGPDASAAAVGRVIVIGAGIIGAACAAWLAREGRQVVVIDRAGPGEGASFGNAGNIGPGNVLPNAAPGTLRQIPKWVLDPLGPLAIRWRYLPRALPWLLRWIRAGRPEQAAAVSRGLAILHRPSFEHYDPILTASGGDALVRRVGQLFISASAQGAAGTAFAQRMRAEAGVPTEILDADLLRQKEPALARHYQSALYFPEHGHCVDPGGLARTLVEFALRNGSTLVRAEVLELVVEAGAVAGVRLAGGEVVRGGRVVVAAGAWSHRLLAPLGLRLPLEAERGYHVVLPDPGVMPRHPISNRDRAVAATPMADGLRLAGTVEIAGVDAPPDWRRADMLLPHAAEMFPGVNLAGAKRWMGSRPSLPDGLPALGPCPGHPNVLLACGNGHFGLTAAGTMGRVVADLVAGRPPVIELAPFSPMRFG
ncbi:MAG: FAD-dependent oxidoreductase [Alphaproteobacteria bacterium]|nr:FAD-dependent oxidoreductase [Alphaproteobacteria bacterium]